MTGLTDRRGFYLLAEQKLRGGTSQRPYRLAASHRRGAAPAHGAGATVDELLTRADELMYDEKDQRQYPRMNRRYANSRAAQ